MTSMWVGHLWDVPWSQPEVINTVFLAVATLIVGAIPLVYVARANLRDPLARAVLAGTGATALVFTVSLVFLVAYHMGFNPPLPVWNWLTRATYLVVALGELVFLFALLRVLREGAIKDSRREAEKQQDYDDGYADGERDNP